MRRYKKFLGNESNMMSYKSLRDKFPIFNISLLRKIGIKKREPQSYECGSLYYSVELFNYSATTTTSISADTSLYSLITTLCAPSSFRGSFKAIRRRSTVNPFSAKVSAI